MGGGADDMYPAGATGAGSPGCTPYGFGMAPKGIAPIGPMLAIGGPCGDREVGMPTGGNCASTLSAAINVGHSTASVRHRAIAASPALAARRAPGKSTGA